MTELDLERIVIDYLKPRMPTLDIVARAPVIYAAGTEQDRAFKVDILVRDAPNARARAIPRVAVELKAAGFTTHDLLTYSAKARLHRSASGFLRYGIFAAGTRADGITAKWLWHGQEFDFMLCCRSSRPHKTELEQLAKIIRAEVQVSTLMEHWRTQSRGPWPHLLWRRTLVR